MSKIKKLYFKILVMMSWNRASTEIHLLPNDVKKVFNILDYEARQRYRAYNTWPVEVWKWDSTRYGTLKPEIQEWLDKTPHIFTAMNYRKLSVEQLRQLPEDKHANYTIVFASALSAVTFKLAFL